MSRITPVRMRFLGFLLVVAGPVWLIWGAGVAWEAFSSKGWDEVPGKVQKTRITKEKGFIFKGSSGWKYVPHARVRYRVAGRAYTADRLRVGDYSLDTRQAARQVLSRYKRGSQVRVFHHPDEPGRAVLEPGLFASNMWKPAVGGGMLLLGLFVLMLVRPRRKAA